MKEKIERMIKVQELLKPLEIKIYGRQNLFVELIKLNKIDEGVINKIEEIIIEEEIEEEEIEEVIIQKQEEKKKEIERKEVEGLEKFDIFMKLWKK